MGHLELAGWAQRVIVAPATANTIAKLAHGLADDLVSTLCLATDRAAGNRPGDEPPDVAASCHPGQMSRCCVRAACR
jgi:hypothetical protein